MCPFMLTIELQELKGKEVYNDIVYRDLSQTDLLKKLKLHNYPSEAKNTIINNTLGSKEELGEISI